LHLLDPQVLSGPPSNYPDTVATTWNIAFDEVMQLSSSGADLLKLCAFLAPDDIPVELLNSGLEYLPESLTAMASDPLAFDDAVDPLRRYSLVEITSETISVHRLVQAVTRDRLDEDEKKKWAEAAVRIVDEAFPFDSDDVGTWPVCSRLLPHALAAAEYAEALDVASDSTGRLMNETGVYLDGRAQFNEAKEMFERALHPCKPLPVPGQGAGHLTHLPGHQRLLCQYIRSASVGDQLILSAPEPSHPEA